MRLTKTETKNLRELDKAYDRTQNVIKWGSKENFEHFSAKCKLGYYFKRNSSNFVCEAILTNSRGRIDLFNISNSVCYEIISSEKEESIEKKREKYPCIIIALKAEEVLNSTDEELEKLL